MVAGLVASGLPTHEFHFVGFLPVKSGQRSRELDRILVLPGTLVLYESPYRVEKLLTELSAKAPTRPMAFARELSKRHEEFLRGKPGELLKAWKERPRKGEFVIMVGQADPETVEEPPAESA